MHARRSSWRHAHLNVALGVLAADSVRNERREKLALVEPVDVLVFVGVGEVVAETPSRRRAVALARDLRLLPHLRKVVFRTSLCLACTIDGPCWRRHKHGLRPHPLRHALRQCLPLVARACARGRGRRRRRLRCDLLNHAGGARSRESMADRRAVQLAFGVGAKAREARELIARAARARLAPFAAARLRPEPELIKLAHSAV
mmetsp:Transcript_46254/g.100454  ORF Transcript_46254/g.100454 Transcript_46254/m.100454 type:complete len:202 (+) Transcript_46254:871-1476(+)